MYILGNIGVHIGNIGCTYWGTLVYILGNISVHIGKHWSTYWRTLVYILGNISVHIGNIGVYDQHAHCYLKLWGSSENQL